MSHLPHRRASRRLSSAVLIGALALLMAVPAGSALAAKTVKVSIGTGGAPADKKSGEPQISATGRHVVFFSSATNLVANDTNGVDDCFIRDLAAKKTTRVTVNNGGQQGDGNCYGPSVSADGTLVAFESRAGNLSGTDNNGTWDIFVRNLDTGETERITNGDGGASRDASISGNGRYVVYESLASDPDPGDGVPADGNGVSDVFVFDRNTDTTTRLSVSDAGYGQGSFDPSITTNGQLVAFESWANGLVANDTNDTRDIFVVNVNGNNMRRVNLRWNGRQATGGQSFNAVISANGKVVAFDSAALNLVRGDTNDQEDVFVRDLAKNATKRVSVRNGGGQAAGGGYDPTISGNGRWIAFSSAATNLVAGDTNRKTDAFVHDRVARTTKRVSVKSSGGQATRGGSDDVFISKDGKWVTFESLAPNLVSGDSNKKEDVFRRGRF